MSWGYADKNIKDLKENRNFVANHMNWTQVFLLWFCPQFDLRVEVFFNMSLQMLEKMSGGERGMKALRRRGIEKMADLGKHSKRP